MNQPAPQSPEPAGRAKPQRSLAALEIGFCALAIPALVFWGFSPSYYLRVFSTIDALPPLLHVHGFAMTVWVALFVIQALLIIRKRGQNHRRIGRFGAPLFVAAWLSAALVAIAQVQREKYSVEAWTFLADPLCDLLGSGVLVTLALIMRKRRDWHGRLMVCGALAMLVPAVARIRIGNGIELPSFTAQALISFCGALVFVIDSWRIRRVHGAMALGLVVLLAALWLRGPLSTSQWWQSIRPIG